MEYNQFKQLLSLKGIREKETVSLLDDFIKKFPYCQTSRLLYTKALHDQNNIHYDQHLKLAAAYAPNREVLRDLIEMKSEEAEFDFPLSRKEAPAQEFVSQGKEDVIPDTQKEEVKFDEWYSEDEISGRAFQEQEEKEKPVDPHSIIKRRLSEILGAPSPPNDLRNSQMKEDISAQAPIDNVQKEIIIPEEIKVETAASSKADPEESVYPEEILAEKKLEAEQIHPTPEKSEEEKVIIAQAEKARDVLDRMELEHAMEESILDSIEKLPLLATSRTSVSSPKEREGTAFFPTNPAKASAQKSPSFEGVRDATTPRPFTEWLKKMGATASGFEEVHAPKRAAVIDSHAADSNSYDEQEDLLSDDELIEKFLLEDPKIGPSKAEFYSPVSQAKKSVMDHDDVVSETLAQIYLRQGNTQKARWCYEKLILLHPEKSAFFAALLKEISEGE